MEMRKVTELRLEECEVLRAVAEYVQKTQKISVSENDVVLCLRIAYRGRGTGTYETAVCDGARVKIEG